MWKKSCQQAARLKDIMVEKMWIVRIEQKSCKRLLICGSECIWASQGCYRRKNVNRYDRPKKLHEASHLWVRKHMQYGFGGCLHACIIFISHKYFRQLLFFYCVVKKSIQKLFKLTLLLTIQNLDGYHISDHVKRNGVQKAFFGQPQKAQNCSFLTEIEPSEL